MNSAEPAYVPGFDWDIFISYPRESNQRDSYDLEWVEEFNRILEREINERLPGKERIKIYFDQWRYGASDHSEHHLLEAARRSALLLPIVSPKYVAPDKFTIKELDSFCEGGDVKRRIVIIELLPVGSDDVRPPALQGPKRNDFYVTEKGRAIKLTPGSAQYGDEYARRLQIVADDIKDVLQEMRRRGGASIKETQKPYSGKTVLLAEREEGVDREWEHVRGWLREFGATVIPAEGKYPDGDALAEAFGADLAQADMFVQLLSPPDEVRYLVELEGKPSRAKQQLDAACGTARGIPVLQWRRTLEPQAQAFWDRKLRAALEGREVVVTAGVQEFERAIKKKLDELMAPPPAPVATGAKPYVYIAAADEDIDLAHHLKEMAESKLRLTDSCEIMADKNRRRNFRETIKISDVVVFLYGKGNAAFVDEWLREYAKLKACGQAKPPQVEALFRAPPPKTDVRQKLRAPLGSFLPLGSEDAFTPEVMRAIFDELQRRKT